jgi:hypothetical protein
MLQLAERLDIHNYGNCHRTQEVKPEWRNADRFKEKQTVLSHYKFYLAFENDNLTDYVTEKLPQGWEATTVPIYMGAPNIKEYLPHPNSAILTDDFEGPDHLATYLNYLLQNDAAYNSHFEWRKLPVSKLQVPRSYKRWGKYAKQNWACRMCLRMHAMI